MRKLHAQNSASSHLTEKWLWCDQIGILMEAIFQKYKTSNFGANLINRKSVALYENPISLH